MTRSEHLAWAKGRALEYLDRGDLPNAVASMSNDLTKHPDLNISVTLTTLGTMYLMQNDAAGVRRWIEGFN